MIESWANMRIRAREPFCRPAGKVPASGTFRCKPAMIPHVLLAGAVVSDSVSYLPSTPTVGLSGVPGTGDVGIAPVQIGIDNGLGLLTPYSTRLNNSASASLSRRLTARTSAYAGGNYSTLRFVGSS